MEKEPRATGTSSKCLFAVALKRNIKMLERSKRTVAEPRHSRHQRRQQQLEPFINYVAILTPIIRKSISRHLFRFGCGEVSPFKMKPNGLKERIGSTETVESPFYFVQFTYDLHLNVSKWVKQLCGEWRGWNWKTNEEADNTIATYSICASLTDIRSIQLLRSLVKFIEKWENSINFCSSPLKFIC